MSIKTAVTSKFARQILLTKKNSPAILFVVGTAGMVTSTVMACNATLKLNAIFDEVEVTKDKIASSKEIVKNPLYSGETYTEEDAAKDLKILKVQTGVKIVKLYGPALLVGAASVAALTGAHIVLSNRNTALMAAYATLDKGFREYQQRVKDSVGEEKEREIRYAGETYETKDETSGKKLMLNRATLAGEKSMYARFWGADSTTSYQKQPEYNLAFLTAKQNYLNDRLQSRGHVLLNDAYDELGLDRTKEGCVVGWVKGQGDSFIDFGIFGGDGGTVLDFISGYEDGIWLDFNVDGVVYDKI